MISRYPIISRKGWPLLTLLLLALVWAVRSDHLPGALTVGGLLVLVGYLYRDPVRVVPAAPLGVVSPVDGVVTAVETAHNVYLDRPMQRIALRMRLWGGYTLRSPIEGKLLRQWTPADTPGAGRRYAQLIQTDEADDVVLLLRLPDPLRRPSCYVSPGERIGQGQHCGFIHFGAWVEVWVPENARVDVKVGDPVLAGSDIIAHLVHE